MNSVREISPNTTCRRQTPTTGVCLLPFLAMTSGSPGNSGAGYGPLRFGMLSMSNV